MAPLTWSISRLVFLRVLGLSLVFAFTALWLQAPGLIGSRGLSPLPEIMAGLEQAHGGHSYWYVPTLFWISTSDAWIAAVALAGLAAGVLLLLGLLPRYAAALAFLCWLSFRVVDAGGVRWFNFPFDDLQAEITFLGILVAPPTLCDWRRPPPLPRWVHWLVVWFAFRLVLGPGIAKVMYHPPWRELAAMDDFLLTMPHPTPAAAWFHDLGSPWLEAMVVFMFVGELLCPLFYFVPGWPRRVAAAVGIAFMAAIQLVCNIRGFELLTAALLLLLWDDAALRRLRLWRPRIVVPVPVAPATPQQASRLRRAGAATVFALVVLSSIGPVLTQFRIAIEPVPVAGWVARVLAPFHLAGSYTMFLIVPSERFGFVVQASDDGASWSDYELLGIPSRVDRAPRCFAPYHDYLAFRLWFAGFCPPAEDGWLTTLQQRLLAAEPAVEALFTHVPFAGRPPNWVRLVWCRFRFAPPEQRAQGTFWVREEVAVRIPPRRA